ncbi:MAG: hypothetical protein JWO55_65 [Candidatus Saccharibacteria bacterium]|jgi:hypothetical protein|nr:hypothetical protein [Candidatus Saccharibacteria bacterium]
MFGKKRAAKAQVKQAAIDEANQKLDRHEQIYIKDALFGKDPLTTTASGDQAQAAHVEQQKIVNPRGKSIRPKRR